MFRISSFSIKDFHLYNCENINVMISAKGENYKPRRLSWLEQLIGVPSTTFKPMEQNQRKILVEETKKKLIP